MPRRPTRRRGRCRGAQHGAEDDAATEGMAQRARGWRAKGGAGGRQAVERRARY